MMNIDEYINYTSDSQTKNQEKLQTLKENEATKQERLNYKSRNYLDNQEYITDFVDGDTVRTQGTWDATSTSNRFAGGVDTAETNHGNYSNSQKEQNRIDKQKARVAMELGKPLSQVTNQDVFDFGEKEKVRLMVEATTGNPFNDKFDLTPGAQIDGSGYNVPIAKVQDGLGAKGRDLSTFYNPETGLNLNEQALKRGAMSAYAKRNGLVGYGQQPTPDMTPEQITEQINLQADERYRDGMIVEAAKGGVGSLVSSIGNIVDAGLDIAGWASQKISDGLGLDPVGDVPLAYMGYKRREDGSINNVMLEDNRDAINKLIGYDDRFVTRDSEQLTSGIKDIYNNDKMSIPEKTLAMGTLAASNPQLISTLGAESLGYLYTLGLGSALKLGTLAKSGIAAKTAGVLGNTAKIKATKNVTDAVNKIAKNRVTLTGAGIPMAISLTNENLKKRREETGRAPTVWEVVKTALVSAASIKLDYIIDKGVYSGGKKIKKIIVDSLKVATKDEAKSLLTKVIKGTAKAVGGTSAKLGGELAVEGATESLQEAMNIYAERFGIDKWEEKDLLGFTDSETLNRLADAGILGSITSIGMSGAGAVSDLGGKAGVNKDSILGEASKMAKTGSKILNQNNKAARINEIVLEKQKRIQQGIGEATSLMSGEEVEGKTAGATHAETIKNSLKEMFPDTTNINPELKKKTVNQMVANVIGKSIKNIKDGDSTEASNKIAEIVSQIKADPELSKSFNKVSFSNDFINGKISEIQENLATNQTKGRQLTEEEIAKEFNSISNILGSLDLDTKEKEVVDKNLERAKELIAGYQLNKRKYMSEVSEEINDIGFINLKNQKIDKKSLAQHKYDISQDIANDVSPGANVNKLKSFATKRIDALFKSVKSRNGQTYDRRSSQVLEKMQDENEKFISNINEMQDSIDSFEDGDMKTSYTKEFNDVKARIEQANAYITKMLNGEDVSRNDTFTNNQPVPKKKSIVSNNTSTPSSSVSVNSTPNVLDAKKGKETISGKFGREILRSKIGTKTRATQIIVPKGKNKDGSVRPQEIIDIPVLKDGSYGAIDESLLPKLVYAITGKFMKDSGYLHKINMPNSDKVASIIVIGGKIFQRQAVKEGGSANRTKYTHLTSVSNVKDIATAKLEGKDYQKLNGYGAVVDAILNDENALKFVLDPNSDIDTAIINMSKGIENKVEPQKPIEPNNQDTINDESPVFDEDGNIVETMSKKDDVPTSVENNTDSEIEIDADGEVYVDAEVITPESIPDGYVIVKDGSTILGYISKDIDNKYITYDTNLNKFPKRKGRGDIYKTQKGAINRIKYESELASTIEDTTTYTEVKDNEVMPVAVNPNIDYKTNGFDDKQLTAHINLEIVKQKITDMKEEVKKQKNNFVGNTKRVLELSLQEEAYKQSNNTADETLDYLSAIDGLDYAKLDGHVSDSTSEKYKYNAILSRIDSKLESITRMLGEDAHKTVGSKLKASKTNLLKGDISGTVKSLNELNAAMIAELDKISTEQEKREAGINRLKESNNTMYNEYENARKDIKALYEEQRVAEMLKELSLLTTNGTAGFRIYNNMDKTQQQIFKPKNIQQNEVSIYDKFISPIFDSKISINDMFLVLPKAKQKLFDKEETIKSFKENRELIATASLALALPQVINNSQYVGYIEDGKHIIKDAFKPEFDASGVLVNIDNPLTLIGKPGLDTDTTRTKNNNSLVLKFDPTTTEILSTRVLQLYFDAKKMTYENDDKTIIEMFGIEHGDDNALDSARQLLSQGLIPRAALINTIGREVFDSLQLQVRDNMDNTLEERMISALGGLVVSSAQDIGILNMEFKDDTMSTDKDNVILKVPEMLGEKDGLSDKLRSALTSFQHLNPTYAEKTTSPEPHIRKSKKVKNSPMYETNDEIDTFLDKMNSREWSYNSIMEILKQMPRDTLKKIEGWKDPAGMNPNDIPKQLSINLQIEMDLENLFNEYEMYGNTPFYIPWNTTKSDRDMMEGYVNPQGSKIFRFVMGAKDMSAEIENKYLNKDSLEMKLHMVAIAQALDLDPDKKPDEMVIGEVNDTYFTVDYTPETGGVITAKTKDGNNIRLAMEFFTNPEKNKDNAEMLKAIEDIASSTEHYHAIQAIESLVKLDAAIKNTTSFTTDLMIEADAITSGMALTLMQMGGSIAETLLKKTGSYSEKALAEIVTEYNNNLEKGQEKITAEQVNHGLLNQTKWFEDFYTDIGFKAFNSMTKQLEDLDAKLKKGKFKKEDTAGGYMAMLMMKDFYKDDGTLNQKAIRSMAKDPVMVYIYGSSINSIMKNLGKNVGKKKLVDLLRNDAFSRVEYSKLIEFVNKAVLPMTNAKAKIPHNKVKSNLLQLIEKSDKSLSESIGLDFKNMTQEDIESFVDLSVMMRYAVLDYKFNQSKMENNEANWFDNIYAKPIFQIYKNNELKNIDVDFIDKKPTYTKEHTLDTLVVTDAMSASLQQMTDNSVGTAMEDAFTDTFSEVNEYRDVLKTAETMVQQIFSFRLQEEAKKYANDNDVITKGDMRKAIETVILNGDGHNQPTLYKGHEQGLEKVERTNSKNTSNVNISKVSNTLSQEQNTMVDSLMDAMFGKDNYKPNQINKDNMIINVKEKEYISNIRAVATISIHSIDGRLIKTPVAKNNILHIFDALGMSIDPVKYKESTEVYNKETIEVSRGYSFMKEFMDKTTGMIKRLKDDGTYDTFLESMGKEDNVKSLLQALTSTSVTMSGAEHANTINEMNTDKINEIVNRIISGRQDLLSQEHKMNHLVNADIGLVTVPAVDKSEVSVPNPVSNEILGLLTDMEKIFVAYKDNTEPTDPSGDKTKRKETQLPLDGQKTKPDPDFQAVDEKGNQLFSLTGLEDLDANKDEPFHELEFQVEEELSNQLTETLVDDGIVIEKEDGSLEYEASQEEYGQHLSKVASDIQNKLLGAGLTQKLNVAVYETMKRKHAKIDIAKSKMSLFLTSTPDSMFSSSEVFIHEMVHLFTEHALSMSPGIRSKLRKIQKQVSESLNYTVFLNHQTNPTTEDIALAKQMYDYALLGNESEFMAYMMTNKNLINATKNMDISLTLVNKIDETGKISKLINKFIDIINKIYKANMKANGPIIEQLTYELMDLQMKKTAGIINKREEKTWEIRYKKFDDTVKKYNGKLGEKLESLGAMADKKIKSSNIVERVTDINGLRQVKDTRLFQDIYNEVTQSTADEKVAGFYDLFRVSKKTQESDKEAERTVLKNIFNKQLEGSSENERKALKRVMVDTDATYLLKNGYSASQIASLLDDEKLLQQEIAKLRGKIGNTQTGRDYSEQAEGLGYYMVHQKSPVLNQMKNAKNIYNGLFKKTTNDKYQILDGNPKEMIDSIEKLASLYAIKYSGEENKKLASKILKDNEEGVSMTLDIYHNYMQEYTSSLFTDAADENSIELKVKGYSFSTFDENKNQKLVKEEDVPYFEMMGMKIAKDVTDLTFDKTPGRKYIMVGDNIDPTYHKGNMDILSFRASGTKIGDIIRTDGNPQYKVDEIIADFIQKGASHMSNGKELDIDNNNLKMNLIPSLGIDGKIHDYSTEMSHDEKVQILTMNDDISDVLSNTLTDVKAKNNAVVNNIKAVDYLLNDTDKNYSDASHEFITIEPSRKGFVSSTEEQWKMIPQYTRDYIFSQTGENKLTVRQSLLNDVMGYKSLSIAEIKWLKDKHPRVARALAVLEEAWMSLVSKFKGIIVTMTGDVVFGNMVSNMMFAWQHGANPIKFAKHSVDAWNLLTQYEADNARLTELKILKTGGDKSVKDSQIKALEMKLKNNDMHELIENGMFTPIVEDVNIDVIRRNSTIDKKIDKIIGKLPPVAKKGLDYLYLNESTQLYQGMLKLIQYGDITARYAVLQEEKRKGNFDSKKIMRQLDEMLVNYAYNENKILRYLNDIGLFMFSKYFLRTPKAIARMVKSNPTFAAMFQGSQYVTGIDVIDPLDTYNDIFGGIANRISNPFDLMGTIIEPHILAPIPELSSMVDFNA